MLTKKFWPWAASLLLLVCVLNLPWDSLHRAAQLGLSMGDGVDQPLLVAGLERTTSWNQVLGFWHGSWVGGEQVKFFRPLTSTLWWLEFNAFGGSQGAALPFIALHFLSHFGVCLLLAGFLRRVVGGPKALLGALLWAGNAADGLTLPVPYHALNFWKDDPDVWVTGAVIAALWLLLCHLRTGKRSYLIALFGMQLVAISVKEMAYVLPFLALALCWHEKQLGRYRIVMALFGVTVAAYAYRFRALSGPGFRFGTNGSWLDRWLLQAVGGRPLNLAFSGDAGALTVALLLAAALFALRHRWNLAKWAGGLGLAGMAWNDWNTEPGNLLLRLLTPLCSTFISTGISFYQDTLVALLLLLLWWDCATRRDRDQIFGYGWVVLAYLPLMTAPITDHALYLPSIGWAIWLSVPLERFARRIWSRVWPRQFGVPHVIPVKSPS